MCDSSQEENMGHLASKIKQFFCPENDTEADKAPLFIKEKKDETPGKSIGQNPLAASDSEECTDQMAEYLCQIQILECKLAEQQELVEEHENKIRMLEDIIQRQLLVIKEKHSKFDKEDSIERKDDWRVLKRENSVQSLSSTDSRGVLEFIEDVVGSVENVFSDRSVRILAKHIKSHEKELEQQREKMARHEQTLEEHITTLQRLNLLLDQNERFFAIERRTKKQASELAKCQKQLREQNAKILSSMQKQDSRLDDAWSAIWINIITIILAVFFSKISSLWT